MRFLTALPVYNEAAHVPAVLDEVLRYSPDVLVVNDGSKDSTAEILAARNDVRTVTHPVNRGYGAALKSAFEYARAEGFDVLVTIDCDGQHQPCRIPEFVTAIDNQQADVVSGSRYLKTFDHDSVPPADRRRINEIVTKMVNDRLNLRLTDAFCGFKSYRVSKLSALHVTEMGYAMPLEAWVQIAQAGLKVVEWPVPLIYLDEKRSFGGSLDDANTRLDYYQKVLDRCLAEAAAR